MSYPAHFTLAEFLYSDTARKMGIENLPTWQVADNLRRLGDTMDRVRSVLGDTPVTITSGFRCPVLNSAVGGVPDSAHLYGLACDFTAGGFGTPLDVCLMLEPYLAELDIDQLINESGWIHLGLAADGCIPRLECWTIDQSGTRAGFG